MNLNNIYTKPSTLASLRQLVPTRRCTPEEARRIAEAQATKLIDLVRACDPVYDGVVTAHLQDLPRMHIAFERLPVSGMSHWNGRSWVIVLNSGDSPARQRFTLLHEFKHVVDHGACDRLYYDVARRNSTNTAKQQAEQAADYFAGCALVPKRELKRAWGRGMQSPKALADHFGVSEQAILVRLDQTGLSREWDPEPEQAVERCARPVRTPMGWPQQFAVARHSTTRRFT